MRQYILAASAMLFLASCGSGAPGKSAGNGEANVAASEAAADPEAAQKSTAMRRRAEALVARGGVTGVSRITRAEPVFTISARTPWGNGTRQWGVDARRIVELSVPLDPAGASFWNFTAASGTLIATIGGVNGWHLYVECDVDPAGANIPLRWDARMGPNTTVSGMASFDAGTNRYFFATPAAAAEDDRVTVTVDRMTVSGATDYSVRGCDYLPFN